MENLSTEQQLAMVRERIEHYSARLQELGAARPAGSLSLTAEELAIEAQLAADKAMIRQITGLVLV